MPRLGWCAVTEPRWPVCSDGVSRPHAAAAQFELDVLKARLPRQHRSWLSRTWRSSSEFLGVLTTVVGVCAALGVGLGALAFLVRLGWRLAGLVLS